MPYRKRRGRRGILNIRGRRPLAERILSPDLVLGARHPWQQLRRLPSSLRRNNHNSSRPKLCKYCNYCSFFKLVSPITALAALSLSSKMTYWRKLYKHSIQLHPQRRRRSSQCRMIFSLKLFKLSMLAHLPLLPSCHSQVWT